MTNATACTARALIAPTLVTLALAFGSTSFAQESALELMPDPTPEATPQPTPRPTPAPVTPNPEPIAYHDGTFRQGAYRLAVDASGVFHLLAADGNLIDGIALGGIHDGAPWSVAQSGDAHVTRGEDGLTVEVNHPSGNHSYTVSITPDKDAFVLSAQRRGALPTEDSEDYLRLSLPVSFYRGGHFYNERVTLPYDDRTFEEPMIIDGIRDFRAHTTNDMLNFTIIILPIIF